MANPLQQLARYELSSLLNLRGVTGKASRGRVLFNLVTGGVCLRRQGNAVILMLGHGAQGDKRSFSENLARACLAKPAGFDC
jgi:hypothetical protein